ncbi:MAG: hypothetical protein ACTHKG_12595 [Nocardioides sp.]
MAERRRGRRTPPARVVLLAGAAAALLLLAGCAAGANPASGEGEAGFWLGLWHGLILPVTFVISLFTDDVSIYETANSGNWYDAGFVLGAVCSLSGGGAASRSGR